MEQGSANVVLDGDDDNHNVGDTAADADIRDYCTHIAGRKHVRAHVDNKPWKAATKLTPGIKMSPATTQGP